jgi:hypothetical protein
LLPYQFPNLLLARLQGFGDPIAGYANDHGVIDPAHFGQSSDIEVGSAVTQDTHPNAVDLALNSDFKIKTKLLAGAGD